MTIPYVFLHPLGADRHFWDPVIDAGLIGNAVALELTGHGMAPPPLGADIGAYTWPVAARIEEHGGPVHVVGLSLGGLVAQQIALQHRHLVASITLVGTVAVYSEERKRRRCHAGT